MAEFYKTKGEALNEIRTKGRDSSLGSMGALSSVPQDQIDQPLVGNSFENAFGFSTIGDSQPPQVDRQVESPRPQALQPQSQPESVEIFTSDDDSSSEDTTSGNAFENAFGFSTLTAPALQEQPEEEEEGFGSGLLTALGKGFSQTGRAVATTFDVLTGDLSGVEAKELRSREQRESFGAEASKQFNQEVQDNITKDGDDTILAALKNVGKAAVNNPEGALQMFVEQAPNSALALGSGYALGKAGAIAGTAILPGVGTLIGGGIGFLSGLFGASFAIETGFKAQEKAVDGFTEEERGEALKEGAVKSAVITGVDALTLGASRGIASAASRAIERSTSEALKDAGLNAKDLVDGVKKTQGDLIKTENYIQASDADKLNLFTQATASKMYELGVTDDIFKAVQQKQSDIAFEYSKKLKKVQKGVPILLMETVGEGTGEYFGEMAATGEASRTDAVLESFMGLAQSLPEAAWALKTSGADRIMGSTPVVEDPSAPRIFRSGATTEAFISADFANKAKAAANDLKDNFKDLGSDEPAEDEDENSSTSSLEFNEDSIDKILAHEGAGKALAAYIINAQNSPEELGAIGSAVEFHDAKNATKYENGIDRPLKQKIFEALSNENDIMLGHQMLANFAPIFKGVIKSGAIEMSDAMFAQHLYSPNEQGLATLAASYVDATEENKKAINDVVNRLRLQVPFAFQVERFTRKEKTQEQGGMNVTELDAYKSIIAEAPEFNRRFVSHAISLSKKDPKDMPFYQKLADAADNMEARRRVINAENADSFSQQAITGDIVSIDASNLERLERVQKALYDDSSDPVSQKVTKAETDVAKKFDTPNWQSTELEKKWLDSKLPTPQILDINPSGANAVYTEQDFNNLEQRYAELKEKPPEGFSIEEITRAAAMQGTSISTVNLENSLPNEAKRKELEAVIDYKKDVEKKLKDKKLNPIKRSKLHAEDMILNARIERLRRSRIADNPAELTSTEDKMKYNESQRKETLLLEQARVQVNRIKDAEDFAGVKRKEKKAGKFTEDDIFPPDVRSKAEILGRSIKFKKKIRLASKAQKNKYLNHDAAINLSKKIGIEKSVLENKLDILFTSFFKSNLKRTKNAEGKLHQSVFITQYEKTKDKAVDYKYPKKEFGYFFTNKRTGIERLIYNDGKEQWSIPWADEHGNAKKVADGDTILGNPDNWIEANKATGSAAKNKEIKVDPQGIPIELEEDNNVKEFKFYFEYAIRAFIYKDQYLNENIKKEIHPTPEEFENRRFNPLDRKFFGTNQNAKIFYEYFSPLTEAGFGRAIKAWFGTGVDRAPQAKTEISKTTYASVYNPTFSEPIKNIFKIRRQTAQEKRKTKKSLMMGKSAIQLMDLDSDKMMRVKLLYEELNILGHEFNNAINRPRSEVIKKVEEAEKLKRIADQNLMNSGVQIVPGINEDRQGPAPETTLPTDKSTVMQSEASQQPDQVLEEDYINNAVQNLGRTRDVAFGDKAYLADISNTGSQYMARGSADTAADQKKVIEFELKELAGSALRLKINDGITVALDGFARILVSDQHKQILDIEFEPNKTVRDALREHVIAGLEATKNYQNAKLGDPDEIISEGSKQIEEGKKRQADKVLSYTQDVIERMQETVVSLENKTEAEEKRTLKKLYRDLIEKADADEIKNIEELLAEILRDNNKEYPRYLRNFNSKISNRSIEDNAFDSDSPASERMAWLNETYDEFKKYTRVIYKPELAPEGTKLTDLSQLKDVDVVEEIDYKKFLKLSKNKQTEHILQFMVDEALTPYSYEDSVRFLKFAQAKQLLNQLRNKINITKNKEEAEAALKTFYELKFENFLFAHVTYEQAQEAERIKKSGPSQAYIRFTKKLENIRSDYLRRLAEIQGPLKITKRKEIVRKKEVTVTNMVQPYVEPSDTKTNKASKENWDRYINDVRAAESEYRAEEKQEVINGERNITTKEELLTMLNRTTSPTEQWFNDLDLAVQVLKQSESDVNIHSISYHYGEVLREGGFNITPNAWAAYMSWHKAKVSRAQLLVDEKQAYEEAIDSGMWFLKPIANELKALASNVSSAEHFKRMTQVLKIMKDEFNNQGFYLDRQDLIRRRRPGTVYEKEDESVGKQFITESSGKPVYENFMDKALKGKFDMQIKGTAKENINLSYERREFEKEIKNDPTLSPKLKKLLIEKEYKEFQLTFKGTGSPEMDMFFANWLEANATKEKSVVPKRAKRRPPPTMNELLNIKVAQLQNQGGDSSSRSSTLAPMGAKRHNPIYGVMQVQEIITDLIKDVKNAPGIEVVQDMNHLKYIDSDFYDEVKASLPEGHLPKALFDIATGKIYMFANNLESESDVQFTLFHEMYAHYGMRVLLGTEFDSFLSKQIKANSQFRKAVREMQEAEGLTELEAADEVIADMVENDKAMNFIQAVAYKIIRMLDQLGFKYVANYLRGLGRQFGDTEILFYLQDAKRKIDSGDTFEYSTNGVPNEIRFATAASQAIEINAVDKDGNLAVNAIKDPISTAWYVFQRPKGVKGDVRDGEYSLLIFNTSEEVEAYIESMGLTSRIRAKTPKTILARTSKDLAKFIDLSNKDIDGKDRTKLGKYWRQFVWHFQNQYKPIAEMVDYLERKIGKNIPDRINVIKSLLFWDSKTAGDISKFRTKHIDSILNTFNDLKKSGLTIEQIEAYLYIKHAPERNNSIFNQRKKSPRQKIDKNSKDYSGISTNQAEKAIKAFDDNNEVTVFYKDGETEVVKIKDEQKQGIESLSEQLNALSEDKVKYMYSTGLISRTAYRGIIKYNNYVNLSGNGKEEEINYDDLGDVAGRFEVKGGQARAKGRQTIATDLVANTVLSAESAIVRGQKNMVNQTMMEMLETFYDPAQVEINKIATHDSVDKDGYIRTVTDERYRDSESVFTARINGVEYTYGFPDSNDFFTEIVKSLRGPEVIENKIARIALNYSRNINRFLSRLITTYNPLFVVVNGIRDMQTAMINMSVDKNVGTTNALKMARNWPKAALIPPLIFVYQTNKNSSDPGKRAVAKGIKTMLKAFGINQTEEEFNALEGPERAGTSFNPYVKNLFEMKEQGALTLYLDRLNSEETIGDLRKAINKAQGKTGKISEAIKQPVIGLGLALESLSTLSEIAPRLACYTVLREDGKSVSDASKYAKELTTNFSMRGRYQWLSSLYIFINPAIQGTERMFRDFKSGRWMAAGAKLAALGVLTNIVARALDSGDEEEEDRGYDSLDMAATYKRSTSILWKTDTALGSVPLAYGWNIPYAIGHFMYDWVGGHTSFRTAASRSAITTAEAFLPNASGMQSESVIGSAAKFITPTAVNPLIGLMLNENRFGGPISKEDVYGNVTPDAYKGWSTVNPGAEHIAMYLNEVTGGGQAVSGAIDVSPGTIDFLVNSYIPGAIATTYNALGRTYRVNRGEDIQEAYPLTSRLRANTNPGWINGAYARMKEEAMPAYEEVTKFPGSKKAREILDDEMGLVQMAALIKDIDQDIKAHNTELNKIKRVYRQASGEDKDRLEAELVRVSNIVRDVNYRLKNIVIEKALEYGYRNTVVAD